MSEPALDQPGLLKAYKTLRFLVVDDFENFRRSIRQMLRSFGAEHVEEASDGNEAVYKCTYERFDVVLCDYNMGDGKNGQQVLEELRHKKLLRHTSIFVLVTAETSRDIVMSAREHQPDTYITKPITRALLQKRVEALIEQRQALYPVNHEIDLENLPRAISLCNELLPKLPRYRTWLLKTLADLYYQTGDYSHARKIYDEVLASRELPWAMLGVGKVLAAEQKRDEAIAQFDRLIAQFPDFIEAYDWQSRTLQANGQDRRAQKVLEQAVALSPRAVPRQQALAQVSSRNQDLETAVAAWRSTVKLSNNSVHDHADHYLDLGRCLSDLSEAESSSTAKGYADEALKTLGTLERRFRDDDAAKLKGMLIESRVHAGQGREKESRQRLEEARARIDPEQVDAATGLELARTLYSLDDTGAAQQLLTTLAARFEGDNDILQNIEALLDEPVSVKKKIQARAANREGIAAFEAGRLDEAAEAFETALEYVPQHPALNLNLVQVLLKQMEGAAFDPDVIRRCQGRLDRIAHLPPQHRQYKRYQFLRQKVDGFKQPSTS